MNDRWSQPKHTQSKQRCPYSGWLLDALQRCNIYSIGKASTLIDPQKTRANTGLWRCQHRIFFILLLSYIAFQCCATLPLHLSSETCGKYHGSTMEAATNTSTVPYTHISCEMDLLNSMDLKHFSMHTFTACYWSYCIQRAYCQFPISMSLSAVRFVYSSLLFRLQFILFPWILILLRESPSFKAPFFFPFFLPIRCCYFWVCTHSSEMQRLLMVNHRFDIFYPSVRVHASTRFSLLLTHTKTVKHKRFHDTIDV